MSILLSHRCWLYRHQSVILCDTEVVHFCPEYENKRCEITRGETARTSDRVTLDQVVTACVYAIGSGRWPPGHRLPSVRDGSRQFGASPLTVQRAYRRLVDDGLVEAVPRSGFFVSRSDEVQALNSQHADMADLLKRVVSLIRQETDMPSSVALRHLAQSAEENQRLHPELLFLECTQWQAELHAQEIQARLHVACGAICTGEIAKVNLEDPALGNVRWVITTPYHVKQGRSLARALDAKLLRAAIEFGPDLLTGAQSATVVGLDATQAGLIADDLRQLTDQPVEVDGVASIPEEIDDRVKTMLSQTGPQHRIILSTTLWPTLARSLQDHPRTAPYEVHLTRRAWEEIEGAMGL